MKTIQRAPPMDLSAIAAAPSNRRECSITHWAIVLGGGENALEELHRWQYDILCTRWPGLIIAANDVGCHVPDLDHWASFHVDKFERWLQLRTANGWERPHATWGWRLEHLERQTDFVVYPWSGGSSGMLAVQVALSLGCTKVILCGMPMTATPHFERSTEFDRDTVWSEADGHWRSWLRVHALGWFEDDVRSMSGRTRELFGVPTRAWLLR